MEQMQKIVGLEETIPESYLNMITTMVYALEAKDPYTSGHSRRVAAIAAAIAQELGLPKYMVDKIAVTGLIHDIGKIGVRESVLYKLGKLTNDEYQHVISHCEIGERILHPIIKDEEILDMVRHHHEHYDGTGYPDGLSGKDIPLAVRVPTVGDIYSQIESGLAKEGILSKNASILAVADAYDTMLSPRSYRAALSAEAAAKEIQKGAGSQFDPEVAAALLRITNSLAPLFQEERNRTDKEAKRLAKERNKREAEEARKAKKIERQAKKEAERLAKERKKGEAEEARKARKVERQVNKETEPLAKGQPKIEAGEAKHYIDAKIYEGNVKLVVLSPASFGQVEQFKEHLDRVENLRILFVGASVGEGATIAVSVQKPMTLIHTLNEMPIVEKAIKKSKKEIVLTLRNGAGT